MTNIYFIFLACIYFCYGVHTDVFEQLAIRDGRTTYKNSLAVVPFAERKDFLCVIFIKASPNAAKLFLKNYETLEQCEWAVVFYNDTDKKYKDMICQRKGGSTEPPALRPRIIHCDHSKSTMDDIESFIESAKKTKNKETVKIINRFSNRLRDKEFLPLLSKPVMYRDIVGFLPYYKSVLLFDSDLGLEKFNFDYAMKIWECAEAYPPLIVQPLIGEP